MNSYFNPNPGGLSSNLNIHGFVDISVYRKGLLVDRITDRNIILNQAKAEIINALSLGNTRVLARMAIGDRGTLPSNPTVPKIPDASRTALYSEIYRQDVWSSQATTDGNTNSLLLVATFNAVDIPLSAYSDQTNPIVNEVGLIMIDPIIGALHRPPVAAPNTPPADEAVFAMRTYKSVPFEAANETAVTIRYTIFIG